jgi:hypothetical protein
MQEWQQVYNEAMDKGVTVLRGMENMNPERQLAYATVVQAWFMFARELRETHGSSGPGALSGSLMS